MDFLSGQDFWEVGKSKGYAIVVKESFKNLKGENMGDLIIGFIVFVGCIAFAIFVEHIYYSYLDTLPKEKRDELIKRQSEMRCRYCNSTEFEVVGMKRRKLLFQCKRCKRIR